MARFGKNGEPQEYVTRFEKLFGNENNAITNSAALADVAPTLVDSGSARFTSKELNTRRTAVSGRYHRSPSTRSQENIEGAAQSSEAMQNYEDAAPLRSPISQQGITPAYEVGAGGGPGGGVGPGSGIAGQGGYTSPSGLGLGGEPGVTTPGNVMGNAIGNSLAGSAGLGFAKGAAPIGLAAAAMGAPLGLAATMGIQSGISSALGPLGALGLIGTGIANAVEAGQVEAQGQAEFGTDAMGLGAAVAGGQASLGTGSVDPNAAGAYAAMTGFEPMGMMGAIGNLAGLTTDPSEAANQMGTEVAELTAANNTLNAFVSPNQLAAQTTAALDAANTNAQMDAFSANIESGLVQSGLNTSQMASQGYNPVAMGFQTGSHAGNTGGVGGFGSQGGNDAFGGTSGNPADQAGANQGGQFGGNASAGVGAGKG